MRDNDLQQNARDHLWMHFTRMGGFGEHQDVPIIVKGDGCYLWDSNGKRYLDALAGLFSVNIGYGYGEEIGPAALEQMRALKRLFDPAGILNPGKVFPRGTQAGFLTALPTLTDGGAGPGP